MATLINLFQSHTDELANRITAAGWNKARTILILPAPTAEELGYAQRLLAAIDPLPGLENGVLTLLQDDPLKEQAALQGAVDTVVDKYIELEV